MLRDVVPGEGMCTHCGRGGGGGGGGEYSCVDGIRWNFLIRDSLNSVHFSNVNNAYYPSYIEMCINLPLK